MLILTLDTATPWGRFAVAEDGELLAYQPYNLTGSTTDALLPVMDAVLETAGRGLADVDVIGTTVGPGSFTGVRIGVATAKGLAWALGVELAATDTLAAMAADLLAAQPDRDLAVPVLDARRGELFAGVYRRDGAWVTPVAAAACLAPDLWWRRLSEAVPDPEAPVYGGQGLPLLLGQGETLRPELIRRGEPVARPWTTAHPATARVLALALDDAGLRRQLKVHPFTLVPNYLRGSDAEVARKVDVTPRVPSGRVDVHRSTSGEPAAEET